MLGKRRNPRCKGNGIRQELRSVCNEISHVLEDQHISLYERYYKQNLYDRMLEGKIDNDLPPDQNLSPP